VTASAVGERNDRLAVKSIAAANQLLDSGTFCLESRRTCVSRQRIYLGGLCFGALLTGAGGLEAYRLLRLVSLGLQGKCDWFPCANEGTYLALGVALAFAVVGVVALFLTFRRFKQP
jgi:hypothetical protein